MDEYFIFLLGISKNTNKIKMYSIELYNHTITQLCYIIIVAEIYLFFQKYLNLILEFKSKIL